MLAIYVLLLALTSQCSANNALENMELYVGYFPYQAIMETNPKGVCEEIYFDRTQNFSYVECSLNNKVEFDQTVFLFTPRKNATIANPVFMYIFTVNPLNMSSYSLRDDYYFDAGFYEVRIDKIGSDYLVRRFQTMSDNYWCQLKVILGFQYG